MLCAEPSSLRRTGSRIYRAIHEQLSPGCTLQWQGAQECQKMLKICSSLHQHCKALLSPCCRQGPCARGLGSHPARAQNSRGDWGHRVPVGQSCGPARQRAGRGSCSPGSWHLPGMWAHGCWALLGQRQMTLGV